MMAFGGFDNGQGTQPMAEINTTPLVDVMLVLLVIFIITAPLMQQAVPINLPQNESTRLERPPQVIDVAINAEGVLLLGGAPVSSTALQAQFVEATAHGAQPELHLRAERSTRYDRVTEVLASAQRAGIVKIAFVTQPGE